MWTAVASVSAVCGVAFPLKWVVPMALLGVIGAIAVTSRVFAARRELIARRMKEKSSIFVRNGSNVKRKPSKRLTADQIISEPRCGASSVWD